jgi:hypothetical protein
VTNCDCQGPWADYQAAPFHSALMKGLKAAPQVSIGKGRPQPHSGHGPGPSRNHKASASGRAAGPLPSLQVPTPITPPVHRKIYTLKLILSNVDDPFHLAQYPGTEQWEPTQAELEQEVDEEYLSYFLRHILEATGLWGNIKKFEPDCKCPTSFDSSLLLIIYLIQSSLVRGWNWPKILTRRAGSWIGCPSGTSIVLDLPLGPSSNSISRFQRQLA